MGRPAVQLTRQQELALIAWWNEQRPIEGIARDLSVSARTLSRLIKTLRKAGHRLIDRRGRLAHANRRAVSRSARKAGVLVRGIAAARSPMPLAWAVHTHAGFVVAVGTTRSAGNVSRSPAVLVSEAIQQAFSGPPIADIIISDAAGKAIRRLDGLTRREKPL